MFSRPFSATISRLITLTIVFYVAYYFLLNDNFLHLSVAGIIAQSHQLSVKKHLLVLGLIPIYIATMVFGAATLGIYLGSGLQYIMNRFIINK